MKHAIVVLQGVVRQPTGRWNLPKGCTYLRVEYRS